jgi:two-component system NarL family response regulator
LKKSKLVLRILIVEDNSLFRLYFGQFLRILWPDILIDEACDGYHVTELVEKLNPGIIFMDIDLPGANGIVLTKKIKSTHPQIPVVIVTSHDQPEYFEAAKAAGADHYFQKDALHGGKFRSIVNSLVPSDFI